MESANCKQSGLQQTEAIFYKQPKSSGSQSLHQGKMDKRNNLKNGGRPVDGPRGRAAPPPTYNQLQNALRSANKNIDSLTVQSRQSLKERESICNKVHKGELRIAHLEERLEIRARQFNAEYGKNYETISKHTSEIYRLKNSLQLQQEKMDDAQRLSKQDYDEMLAKCEAEKEKVIDLNNQRSDDLKVEYQKKVAQMEEQIQERDTEIFRKDTVILDLRKAKESLAQMLTDIVNQLQSRKAALLQSENAWRAKYAALEQKVTQELVEKDRRSVAKFTLLEDRKEEMEEKFVKEEESCETKEKQTEDGKKDLEELCLKNKSKRRGFLFPRKSSDTPTALQKMKMYKKEMKKREKEEKAYRKKQAKEEKTEREKEEKMAAGRQKGFKQ